MRNAYDAPARRRVMFVIGAALAFFYLIDNTLVPTLCADEGASKPKALVTFPIAPPIGSTTKITIRGSALGDATDVRIEGAGVTSKLINKGETGKFDNYEKSVAGDSQVEFELTVAESAPVGQCKLTIVTPNGEALAPPILIGSPIARSNETEPNNGFRDAKTIELPAAIDGKIEHGKDVDVVAIELKEATRISVEIFARRNGSLLDSLVTIYDSKGHIVAVADDISGSTDSKAECDLLGGKYFIAIQDANDHGGEPLQYRLVVQQGK